MRRSQGGERNKKGPTTRAALEQLLLANVLARRAGQGKKKSPRREASAQPRKRKRAEHSGRGLFLAGLTGDNARERWARKGSAGRRDKTLGVCSAWRMGANESHSRKADRRPTFERFRTFVGPQTKKSFFAGERTRRSRKEDLEGGMGR